MHSPEIDPLPTGRVCSQPARESTGRPWRLCVLLCHIPTPSLGQVAWLRSLACLPAPETGYGRDSDSHFEGKGAQFPSCDSCQATSPLPGCERPVLATVSHIPFHYFILFYLLLFQMPEAVMGKDLQSPFPGNSKSKKGAKLGAQDLCMGSTGC